MAAKDDNNKDANGDKSETCNMVPLSSTTHRFCSSLDTIFFIPAWCPCSSQDFSNWFPSCFQIMIDASQSVSDMWRRGGQKSGNVKRKDKCQIARRPRYMVYMRRRHAMHVHHAYICGTRMLKGRIVQCANTVQATNTEGPSGDGRCIVYSTVYSTCAITVHSVNVQSPSVESPPPLKTISPWNASAHV